VLLHIAFVAAVVTAGVGLTVTVIVYGDPTQPPVVDVGVTMYCTLPAVALLGLLSVWLMFAPDPAVAPVMLPLIVPIVQVNVLAALAVSGMLVVVALQIA
jgi:ABC-type proline/glycine betaine transport system permease subunit